MNFLYDNDICKVFNMRIVINVAVILCALSLVGCNGIFEPKTCGVANSKWRNMATAEQFEVEKLFHEKQRLADQLRANRMSTKQQNKLAKARKKNEKAQARRLKEERNDIKKQQSKIEADLQLKQQEFLHPEMNSANISNTEISSAVSVN